MIHFRERLTVHFILTRGVLTPEGQRAILSARVHGQPIVLWYTTEQKPDVYGLDIQVERIEVPSWVPPNRRDQISDLLAYRIAHEYGGLMLQLDTISLRPAWDLLEDHHDMVLSTDWPENDPNVLTNPEKLRFPYNCIFIARKGCDVSSALYAEAKRRILNELDVWGYTGPYMLTEFVQNDPKIIGAPFPSLCGWAPGYIWRFYLGLETPGPNVRVIHLFYTAFRALYERRYADWARENPFYAGEVARRTDANERLLRCP